MQVRGRAGWVWSLALTCAVGCARTETSASAASAGGEAGSQSNGHAAPTASSASAASETGPDARREMTWEEYYVDVERRARRKGGFVMWLNPPRPVRPTSGSPPPGIVHHHGAPLSSSVR